MAGLEEVGIPGPDHLREALTNCTDPLAAIEEFQSQNGVLLPSLRPALPFLDLHDVRRLEFHQSIMEELRDRLLKRIAELAESPDKNKLKILNELLVKSFPVIKLKSLRPVVMCIMQHLPKIKQEYLSVVIDNQELYNEAAVEVKQQIWQDNKALFGDEVSPLLAKYTEDKENALFDMKTLQQTFFSASPKSRRQDEVVQQLVKMVGRNIKLYDMVLQFLRTLFLRTRNVHYCTLRAEILMALHDLEIAEICTVDPCHKFTWCLDACIREKFVDSKRAKELQGFLDNVRRGQEQVLGDISMILCDPYAIHTVAVSIMKALQISAVTDGLPRQNEEAILLLRMLSLGLGGWSMIDSQYFKEPKLDGNLVTRFLPSIVGMMVEDIVTPISQRLGESTHHTDPVPDSLFTYIRERTSAATVLAYYAVQVTKQKDVHATCRILPLLAQCEVEDHSLHLIVTNLAHMCESYSQLEFCAAVFDKFFLLSISRENVTRHVLRLLWWVHAKVIPARLDDLMKKLKPTNQSSREVSKSYQELVAKIESYEPSPVAIPEKIDSPLMSVPAPTPAHA